MATAPTKTTAPTTTPAPTKTAAPTMTAAPVKTANKESMVSTGTKSAAWILTGFYVLVAGILLYRFGLGDGSGGNWERALVIFNALSAIGFAAVGVLLGTTVQQVNVANAQKEAVNAKTGEANAKASEAKVATHAENLADVAAEILAKKNSGIGGQSLWSGQLPDPADARLREAIVDMRDVLSRRP